MALSLIDASTKMMVARGRLLFYGDSKDKACLLLSNRQHLQLQASFANSPVWPDWDRMVWHTREDKKKTQHIHLCACPWHTEDHTLDNHCPNMTGFPSKLCASLTLCQGNRTGLTWWHPVHRQLSVPGTQNWWATVPWCKAWGGDSMAGRGSS